MTKINISKRGRTAPSSPIRELIPFAQKAKEKGIKIYHLNIGDPDFPIPDKVKEALIDKAKIINRMPYPGFRGQPELLNAWKKYYEDINVIYEIENEDMIVTAGASDAMSLITTLVADAGDEVIVFEPFYAPYQIYAKYSGVKLVAVPLDSKNGYHLPTVSEISKKITNKTKAIFFTNPNNPTGTVFTRKEIETLILISKKHNLFLIGDETYRGMVFDGLESLSLLHLAKKTDLDRIIIADSLSKRLNVCGARIGLILSKNRELMDSAFRFTQGRPYATYLEQEITAPMVGDSIQYVLWLSKQYQKRRDTFIKALQSQMSIDVQIPEGAFYLMLKLPITDTTKFAKWLLTDFSHKNETVMVSPASGFYATPGKGMDEIRIAYVINEKDLAHAAELLALAIKQYNDIT